jgi:hypothetical protein
MSSNVQNREGPSIQAVPQNATDLPVRRPFVDAMRIQHNNVYVGDESKGLLVGYTGDKSELAISAITLKEFHSAYAEVGRHNLRKPVDRVSIEEFLTLWRRCKLNSPLTVDNSQHFSKTFTLLFCQDDLDSQAQQYQLALTTVACTSLVIGAVAVFSAYLRK